MTARWSNMPGPAVKSLMTSWPLIRPIMKASGPPTTTNRARPTRVADLDEALATGAAAVYVLTNTRSLDEEAAAETAGRVVELLFECLHRARCERLRDHLAQAGVLRRIVIDQQGLGDVELVLRHLVVEPHDDAVGRRCPVLVVLGDLADMRVLRDDPVAAVVESAALTRELGIPPDRSGLAQGRELGDRNTLFEQVGTGEVPPLLVHERA